MLCATLDFRPRKTRKQQKKRFSVAPPGSVMSWIANYRLVLRLLCIVSLFQIFDLCTEKCVKSSGFALLVVKSTIS
jgi:hypothetical protein